ncbi:hypothetical protein REPUB_Repub10bG0029600 [Reevesia pubescens]
MSMLNQLPTKVFLRLRGILLSTDQSLCVWCKLVEEDLDQTLLFYSWIMSVWFLFLNWWNVVWCLPPNVPALFFGVWILCFWGMLNSGGFLVVFQCSGQFG